MVTTLARDPNFQGYPVNVGVHVKIDTQPCGPIQVSSYRGATTIPSAPEGSAIVLPLEMTRLSYRGVVAQLAAGTYACLPPNAAIVMGHGLMIYTPTYRGMPQIGGPVEPAGRLKYIDGCSDTLLMCPPVYGEPCLNHLHLPKGICQTQHVHPSDRIGIILRGRGECRTPVGTYKLTEGMFWRIPQGGHHSFHTDDESLDVIAWHPESEFGPKHDDHPMLTRSIVEGVPANDEIHRGIRTTEIRA